MTSIDPRKVISAILKHDAKVTSYKIALLRAINDVVLSYPDVAHYGQDVAIPLRLPAEFWVAYYWPFVDSRDPVMQGPRARRRGRLVNDMAFRPELTKLRTEWGRVVGGSMQPSDGFFVINELRVLRRQASYPQRLLRVYEDTTRSISETLKMPIRYAGPGEWTVFERPTRYDPLDLAVVPIPNTREGEQCLVIRADLWRTFREMSLWIEALCIHEWCLFTENVQQMEGGYVDRGTAYRLLTDRPDSRGPLTWERNQGDLLLLEGRVFPCPWTERRIAASTAYDLDHLLPVAVYPINEMWNLVPTDPHFNSHVKRSRLPSPTRLTRAEPHLALAYALYEESRPLAQAIYEDVAMRFLSIRYSRRECRKIPELI